MRDSEEFGNHAGKQRKRVWMRPGVVRDEIIGKFVEQLMDNRIFLMLDPQKDYQQCNGNTVAPSGTVLERERNYAAIYDINQGPPLVFHGRELFASEAAYNRFAQAAISWEDPDFLTFFDPKALAKAESYLSDDRIAKTGEQLLVQGADPAQISVWEEQLRAQWKELRDSFPKQLYKEVKRMSNPYSKRCMDMEQEMARTIVSSLKPRVLRHILRTGTQFAILDGTAQECKQEFSFNPARKEGGYFSKNLLPNENSLIVAFAPGIREEAIAYIISHEADHDMDFSHRKRFSQEFSGHIDEYIKRDRACIDNWEKFLIGFDRDSSAEDKFKLQGLFQSYAGANVYKSEAKAHRRSMGAHHDGLREKPDCPIDFLLCDRQELLQVISAIQAEIETFMPSDPSKPHPLYPTKQVQSEEITTYMNGITRMYGRLFIRKLLPNLYEAVHKHAITHPGLHDRSGRASL